MTDSRSRFALCALLLAVLAVPAIGQPPLMVCQASANNPLVRGEGYTEPIGDLFMTCTGGVPTAPGSVVPSADITVSLNTQITSKVTAATASNTVLFNDALLLIDEPNTSSQVQHPVLNCGQTGAPDSGLLGPGVCSILGTGDGTSTYDGTAGHPNVFQGRVIDGSNFRTIQFVQVPLDPPGPGAFHSYRITNLPPTRQASLNVHRFRRAACRRRSSSPLPLLVVR